MGRLAVNKVFTSIGINLKFNFYMLTINILQKSASQAATFFVT
jgi:hypothetical protein